MTGQELDELVAQLAPARAAQTAQRCYARRGGRRRNAPGAGVRPLLTDIDRVVLTLVYLRQHCSQKVLAELLEINPHSIGEVPASNRFAASLDCPPVGFAVSRLSAHQAAPSVPVAAPGWAWW